MNVKHLLDITHDDELKSKLQDYFNDEGHSFDLDSYCKKTGCAEFDQLELDGFVRTPDTIECKLHISFSEVESTTCSKIEFNYSKSVILDITIDASGDIDILDSTELWDGQEYGEEFDPGFEDA